MKPLLVVLFGFLCLVRVSPCMAESDPLFFFYDPYQDPLAQRDDYGLLHQMPRVNQTDFALRHATRLGYYFESGEQLVHDPGYVGAVQVALRINGYYCGPIDGIFSPRVSDAIARMQKNNSLNVTGTLTVGVRRALHLP
jgi:hypothetical protein